jgi:geranylgeranylglycerol-phosphate geranylgeranyltransferase
MSKASGLVRLIRPANCLMMGFAVVVGAILASPHLSVSVLLPLAYGFLTGFALTAASMAINDYYDREIDAMNEPHRPIPSGLVSVREAIVFGVLLTAIGFVFAALIGVYCLIIALISYAFLLSYTTVGKRSGLPGNFLVSACVALPFIYGSATVLNRVESNVLLFASMVFLSNSGREITKGIVDVKGDSAQGVKTLAVRYGEKKASLAAVGFYVSAVCLSPIPLLLGLVSLWFVPLVLVTDVGLIVSSVHLLLDSSRENSRKIKNLALVWFIVGLVAFLMGALLR